MPDTGTIAILAALTACCTEAVKKTFPHIFTELHGERSVLLTVAFGVAFTLGAYWLGQLPAAYDYGDAVMFGLGTWLMGSGLYAATRPMRKKRDAPRRNP